MEQKKKTLLLPSLEHFPSCLFVVQYGVFQVMRPSVPLHKRSLPVRGQTCVLSISPSSSWLIVRGTGHHDSTFLHSQRGWSGLIKVFQSFYAVASIQYCIQESHSHLHFAKSVKETCRQTVCRTCRCITETQFSHPHPWEFFFFAGSCSDRKNHSESAG